MSPIKLLLSLLQGVRETNGTWRALCPAHDDHDPSLSVKVGDDGRVLLKCHAGCPPEAIVQALGLQMHDLFPARAGSKGAAPSHEAGGQPDTDWEARAADYRARLTPESRDTLARELQVTPAALDLVELGWNGSAYAVPERDGDRRVIGIHTRLRGGRKLSEAGGHRGLTIPTNLDESWGRIPIVEGVSDVAACATVGLVAVGRPSNTGGAEHLAKLLRGRDVIVVGERDEKPDGSWPGRHGAIEIARKLARAWGRPVRWALPPDVHKDVRAWLEARVAAGLDLNDPTACREAGATLINALEDASEEERPPLSVRVVEDKYGRVLATLYRGDAESPRAADLLYAGRLRPGETADFNEWVALALEGGRKTAEWIGEADAPRIAAALRIALNEYLAEAIEKASGGGDGSDSVAELLVKLALEKYRLGISDTGELFVVELEGPNVALSLRGTANALRQRLAREYRRRYGSTPNGSALNDALTVIAGEAQDQEAETLHLRVARHGDSIVIDIGEPKGRAIAVDAKGWRILERSPVVFRRTALTSAFAMPARGGDIGELWAHLRVPPPDRPLVLAWLSHGLVPGEPHAVLLLGGEQGSAKTTSAERLVALLDPSGAPTRTGPRDTRQHAITVSGSWAVAIDNISNIPDWLSDAWCRTSTGDGWVDRSLYTDDQLAVLRFQRVLALTSIDPGALKGDLGDRLVLVDLERISKKERRSRAKLDAAWSEALPRIFGALLDLLARILATLPRIPDEDLPRMADYARVLAALDAILGTNGLATYAGQTERIAEDVVESDPVAVAVTALARREGAWKGTAEALLAAITPERPPKKWPTSGRGLSGRLRRAAPALQELGVVVVPPGRKDRPRIWRIRLELGGQEGADDSASPAQTVGDPAGAGGARGATIDSTVPPDRRTDRRGANGLPEVEKRDSRRSDGSDGRIPTLDGSVEFFGRGAAAAEDSSSSSRELQPTVGTVGPSENAPHAPMSGGPGSDGRDLGTVGRSHVPSEPAAAARGDAEQPRLDPTFAEGARPTLRRLDDKRFRTEDGEIVSFSKLILLGRGRWITPAGQEVVILDACKEAS